MRSASGPSIRNYYRDNLAQSRWYCAAKTKGQQVISRRDRLADKLLFNLLALAFPALLDCELGGGVSEFV
jgi:hypothetical protein